MSNLPCPACGKSEAKFEDSGALYVHLATIHNPNSVAAHFANYVADHQGQEGAGSEERSAIQDLTHRQYYLEQAVVALIELHKVDSSKSRA